MLRHIFLTIIMISALISCGSKEVKNDGAEAKEAPSADRARWERYVAYVDSVRRVDHSADVYLRSAWICDFNEDYTQALRYTDTVMALVTDSIPLATVNNARYLRSLCFDRLGKTELSISEMKAIIASDDPEDPEFTHESRLNLAHYYLKLERLDEALEALPGSTSDGGRELYREILKAKANKRRWTLK